MSETAKTGVGKEVRSFDVSPQFDAYSGVEIVVDENTSYFAGKNTGRVLQIQNEWGTQAQANAILADLQAKGFQYQPYTASDALLNPAAEIGDGITINDTYSGLYQISRDFSALMPSDIEAPQDEEVDHEFPYEPKQDRVYTREISENKAQIKINSESITAEVLRATTSEETLSSRVTQNANSITSEVTARKNADNSLSSRITQNANSITSEVTERTNSYNSLSSRITQNSSEISAKVSKSGGSSSSFSWSLTDSSWTLKSGSTTVLKATSSGLEIKGKITSSSGQIGGFTIGASALYKGMSSLSSTASGVYVGTDGISVGGGKFKVTSGGEVSAANMTLSGTLNIGGEYITAAALRSGAEQAYNNYGSWNDTTSWVGSNGDYCIGGAWSGNYAYGRASQAWIGSYILNFGSGITILGSSFYDGNGNQCSGSATRSNVVTASYTGYY